MTKTEEMQLVVNTVRGAGYAVHGEIVCVADDLPFIPNNHYLVTYTTCGNWAFLNTSQTREGVHGKTTIEGIDFVIVEVFR